MQGTTWVLPSGAFRLLLAVIVVVNHSTRVDFGFMAVFIFFILSGYWITRMWREKYSALERPYTAFLISRAWRIFPMFLLANALACTIYFALSGAWAIPAYSIPSNLFILGFASITEGDRLAQAWSLDIEMQFYILAPLTIWMFTTKRSRIYPAIITAIAFISYGIFIGMLPIEYGHTILSFFAFFFIGMTAARFREPPGKTVVALSAIAGLAIIGGLLMNPEWRHIIIGGRHPMPIFHYNWPLCAILAFLFAPYALATVAKPSTKTDRDMGELSYIVYLIHMPILSVYVFYFGMRPPLDRVPHLTVTLAVIAAVSLLLLRYFDAPIERARRAFTAGERSYPLRGAVG